MSHSNKLSLWQKIKQLLTAAEPNSANKHPSSKTSNSEAADVASATHGLENEQTQTDNLTGDDIPEASTTTKEEADLIKSSETPIVEQLKAFFNRKQWHYTYYPPRNSDSQLSHHLSLRMRSRQMDCGYLFRAQEGNNLLAVYGILPFLIPESHQGAAMLLITQINYDMLIGNLEMDMSDGEVRYKHAIDVEAVGLDDTIIEHLLQSVVAMTTVSYELFSDLINTPDPSEDIATLLSELRQQEDARTFFLPTQYVQ
ncbi:YbjN domain-containing protein [Psychrobacter sp. F1192]|uniref:YbjN domain-containing protein n=1 Tax=Psychrobacter coccoides TaxID=2818440 RepID=A0ABS3NQ54_9GAMM|nr:YbjN domain-containing protein [Psychrobacter coccoides]MBO1531552.1 YbjN domain-containing protein [Psychrobacter coccoides]